VFSAFSQSQKRNYRQREIGFFGGGSYYIGDINTRAHFRATQPAGGIYYRYSSNFRFAFKFGLNSGTISGSDAASGEPDQIERDLHFQSKIYDLYSNAEFNFVEYRIGHDRYRFTMFIFAGIAGFYFNPQTSEGENLRFQRNEGQSEAYSRFQVSIPFGIGIKWNVGDRCGLGIEWGPRNTFTDYLDDIKGNYPVAAAIVENANGTNSSLAGSMRGNPSTKDWYFFYGVTLSIKLPGNKPCHRGF
jgi:hypothetical protein